jgi:hypothetical protein
MIFDICAVQKNISLQLMYIVASDRISLWVTGF